MMVAQTRKSPADLVLIESWAKRNLDVEPTKNKAQTVLSLVQEIRVAMDEDDEEKANAVARRLALEAFEIAESQGLTPWELFSEKPN